MLVSDTGLCQVVAEQPVAPLELVVVVVAGVEEDSAKLAKVLDAVVDVDDRVEAEPAVPDVLEDPRRYAVG